VINLGKRKTSEAPPPFKVEKPLKGFEPPVEIVRDKMHLRRKANNVDLEYDWNTDTEYGYFHNYSKQEIHTVMLADGPRKEAYGTAC
jgi:hypothetical protein